MLDAPFLFISSFIEPRRPEYYRLLYEVSARGRFNDWIVFFLTAVLRTAKETSETIRKVESTVAGYVEALRGHRTTKPLQLLDLIQSELVFTIPRASEFLGTRYPAAKAAVGKLEEAGVVQKLDLKAHSGKRGPRPDLYYCRNLWTILKRGT